MIFWGSCFPTKGDGCFTAKRKLPTEPVVRKSDIYAQKKYLSKEGNYYKSDRKKDF